MARVKRSLPFLLLAPLGCTVSPQEPVIEIPFALLSSDEISLAQMTPCTYSPITGPGGTYQADGLLELDPNVSPTPGYLLAVQVENFAGPADPITDGEFPETANYFSINQAVITYIAQQDFLAANLPPQATVPLSGRVAPGGLDWASAVLVPTMSSEVVATLLQNLSTQGPGAAGDLILEVQLGGTLEGNAEPMVSSLLSFPIHVCIDCGVNPLSCINGVTAAPSGHGPCCAPQDFFDVCVPCGGEGEPCCAPPETAVVATCSRDADCQSAYGASSTCDADAGVCTAGCNADAAGKPLACVPATTLPIGTEVCNYLNTSGLVTVCASPG